MKIGLDILGGDFAPEANVLGAIKSLDDLPSEIDLILIGDEAAILDILKREGVDPGRFSIVHTVEKIGMGDHAVKAFSKKPNSSIGLGFSMLGKGEIDVFASTGNTGAMLVGSMYSVRVIPGVIRPCITTIMPKLNGHVGIVLDVGSNADCKPDVLYQFGILGSIYAEYIYGIKNPKVGLLNIGEEEEKGNLLTRATFDLMKDTRDFNFIGNVEGYDLFNEKADVIITDGFTGNVVLKQAETVYTLMKAREIQDEYFDRFNYELYGGSPVLGINGNVIIGHGISNANSVKNMIMLAKDVVDANLSEKINKAFN